MKKFNLFGLLIILVGAALLLNALGVFALPENISIWSLAWPALLIVLGIGAFSDAKRFTVWGAGLTLAGLYFLPVNLGVIEALPGEVIWPIIVIIAGLAVFLPAGEKKRDDSNIHTGKSASAETSGNGRVACKAHFSADNRRVSGECFTGADIAANFGAVELDLRGFRTTAANAVIDLNVSFGGVKILLPHGAVLNRGPLNCTLGGVDVKGAPAPGAASVIELQGSVSFGGVELYYPEN